MRVVILVALLALTVSCRSAEAPAVALPAAPATPPADALVTVLGRHLTRAEVEGEEFGSVTAAIFGPLLDRYRAERGIVATDEEVAGFRRAVDHLREEAGAKALVADDETEDDAPLDEAELAEAEAFERQLAADWVVDWKTSKALFEQYGGKVIFQQANPLEPVGAYLAFLREHEAKGSFQIHDAEEAAEFWQYFTADYSRWVVKPARIDYSKPWWEQADRRTDR